MKTKLITTIMITLFLASMLGFVSTAKAHTEADPFVTALIADGGDPSTAVDVGDVLVWNDEDYLYVKYVTTDDWWITEVHLHVANALEAIPQAKGNPIPGKFTYGEQGLFTQEYEFDPIPLTWSPCTSLYIAAHAKVRHPEQLCIVSDLETMVEQRRSGDAATFTPVNAPAVYAWEPGPNYPNDGPDDSGWQANSLWDQQIGTSYHNLFDSLGADWIWESYRVSDPVYGTVLKFERSFQINGYPTGGTLTITCDNGYEARLNDNPVGSDNVGVDWLFSNLKQPYVDTYDWQGVEQYDVSAYLQPGVNTLRINAANEYFDTDDSGNPWPGTESNNPAGLIFALCVDYYREETAWGAGYPFPGANWATYFTYHVQWDLLGDWLLDFLLLGDGHWLHDMVITSQTAGTFSGSGGYPWTGPPYSHPWTLTGTISGNTVTFTIVYGPGAPNPGYTVWATGTINPDGSMSGAATSSIGQSFTWTATRP